MKLPDKFPPGSEFFELESDRLIVIEGRSKVFGIWDGEFSESPVPAVGFAKSLASASVLSEAEFRKLAATVLA